MDSDDDLTEEMTRCFLSLFLEPQIVFDDINLRLSSKTFNSVSLRKVMEHEHECMFVITCLSSSSVFPVTDGVSVL